MEENLQMQTAQTPEAEGNQTPTPPTAPAWQSLLTKILSVAVLLAGLMSTIFLFFPGFRQALTEDSEVVSKTVTCNIKYITDEVKSIINMLKNARDGMPSGIATKMMIIAVALTSIVYGIVYLIKYIFAGLKMLKTKNSENLEEVSVGAFAQFLTMSLLMRVISAVAEIEEGGNSLRFTFPTATLTAVIIAGIITLLYAVAKIVLNVKDKKFLLPAIYLGGKIVVGVALIIVASLTALVIKESGATASYGFVKIFDESLASLGKSSNNELYVKLFTFAFLGLIMQVGIVSALGKQLENCFTGVEQPEGKKYMGKYISIVVYAVLYFVCIYGLYANYPAFVQNKDSMSYINAIFVIILSVANVVLAVLSKKASKQQ